MAEELGRPELLTEGPRPGALAALADFIVQRRRQGLRVAVDGRDAAGKTTLADELATELMNRQLEVVRAGIDAWHNAPQLRYRLGRDSPLGYYRDSFDLSGLRSRLLEPFSSGEPFVTATYDYRTSSPVDSTEQAAGERSILLFDGVFLLRPELRDCWDLTVYVSLPEPAALERGVARDSETSSSQDEVRTRYLKRYMPGQAIYHEEARPEHLADFIFDNTDVDCPVLLKRPGSRRHEPGRACRSPASTP